MKKLNKLVDGIKSIKNKMITCVFFFIVIGAGLSVTSFGQTGQSAEFYDPIAPLFPTDAQECRVLQDNWNERLNALMRKKHNCTKQATEVYSTLEHARVNKGRDFPSCPSHLRWTIIVYECSPQHLEYCHAWDRRDKQVKECFASVAEAVPDNSEELIAIYNRIEKKATDTYKRVNPGQSTGQQIARNQFKDSMKKISNIHRQVLKDLAQAKARLASDSGTTADAQSTIGNSSPRSTYANESELVSRVTNRFLGSRKEGRPWGFHYYLYSDGYGDWGHSNNSESIGKYDSFAWRQVGTRIQFVLDGGFSTFRGMRLIKLCNIQFDGRYNISCLNGCYVPAPIWDRSSQRAFTERFDQLTASNCEDPRASTTEWELFANDGVTWR